MKIDILTIFPKMIETYINESIIKRAIEDEKITINVINLRDYSKLSTNQVDDTPYGGGGGMLLMFPPFYDALKTLKKTNTKVILPSPKGVRYDQKTARRLAKSEHLVILCGHYEGIDHRVMEFVDEEISLGDYILTGGELSALVLVDSITRLQKGVIKEESHQNESFEDGLLEHPHYTKPQSYEGYDVPEVLTSGHHEKINKWRRFMSLKETYLKRPDLLKDAALSEEDLKMLKEIEIELKNTWYIKKYMLY